MNRDPSRTKPFRCHDYLSFYPSTPTFNRRCVTVYRQESNFTSKPDVNNDANPDYCYYVSGQLFCSLNMYNVITLLGWS